MKLSILPIAAGMYAVGSFAFAETAQLTASENAIESKGPVVLTDTQMDRVTAAGHTDRHIVGQAGLVNVGAIVDVDVRDVNVAVGVSAFDSRVIQQQD